jgi:hypothetical protein
MIIPTDDPYGCRHCCRWLFLDPARALAQPYLVSSWEGIDAVQPIGQRRCYIYRDGRRVYRPCPSRGYHKPSGSPAHRASPRTPVTINPGAVTSGARIARRLGSQEGGTCSRDEFDRYKRLIRSRAIDPLFNASNRRGAHSQLWHLPPVALICINYTTTKFLQGLFLEHAHWNDCGDYSASEGVAHGYP